MIDGGRKSRLRVCESGQGRNIVRSISAMCSSRRDVGSKTSWGATTPPGYPDLDQRDRVAQVDHRDKDIARFHFHILRMLACVTA